MMRPPQVKTSVPGTLAYAQWVIIEILNKSKSKPIKITKLSLTWGKLHTEGNKDNEIEIEDVNNTVINPGDSYTIYSCGRENASSGTEGTFDLVESSGGKFIRTFYWDCPWGSKQNKAEVRGSNSAWLVEPNGFNYDSGALGNGKLTCVYIADL